MTSAPQPANPPSLSWRLGLAILRGVPASDAPPWMVWDPRLDALVAPGHRYAELRQWAAGRDIAEADTPSDALDTGLMDPRRPRDYQQEAVARWHAAGRRGSVVLPTGAGKTLVALLAIREVARGSCVVAPTRARRAVVLAVADAFGPERVGAWYGDDKDI